MAEDKIDSYIDRSGVESDTKFMLEKLNTVYDGFKKLDSVTISLNGVKGLKEMEATLQNLNEQLKSYQAASRDAIRAAREDAKLRADNAKAMREEARASESVTKAKQKEANASQQTEAARVREKKLTDEAINDYLQLSKAYNEAALKAKNYALRLGEQHPITVQAVKDANDLSTILKKLDASVGQNQRNVGNYKSAFDGLGMSFTQVARELPSLTVSVQQFALAISNNLPMVADELKKAKDEIAALKAEGKDTPSLFKRITGAIFSWQIALSLGITALTYLVGMFSKTKKETKEAADAQFDYGKAVAESRKEVAAEVADVRVLVEQLKSENLTKRERVATIKELQRISPQYFGLLNEEKATVDQVTRSYDAFINSVNKSVEARVLNKQLDDIVDQRLKLEKALGIGAKTVETAVVNGRTVITAINATYRDQAELTKDQEKYNKLKKDEEAIVKRLAFLQPKQVGEATKPKKDDAAQKAKEEADKRLQVQFEIQKIGLQQAIDYNKAIADDESINYEKRLEAARVYADRSAELFNLEATLNRKIGNKTNAEIELVNAELADKLERLTLETTKMRGKIWKDGAEGVTKDEKELQKQIEKLAADGVKKFEDKEKERLKIQEETGKKMMADRKKILEEEKQLYRELYNELTGLGTDFLTAQQDREISQIEDQINALELKKNKDIEVANQTISVAADREKAISEIEARAAAQKAQLDRQKLDAERKKKDLDKIGQAANIIGDVAQGITNLTIKAAEAKAQASVLASNPFTAPFAAAALANAGLIAAQIPLVAGIGAAQLARVLIPRYKHGKGAGNNYEGPAIVGDGGRSELIEREDGSLEITPDRPTLTYVKKRDIVHADASKAITAAAMKETSKALLVHGKPVATKGDNVERKLDEVVQAIKNQKRTEIKAGEGALTQVVKFGATQLNYLNDNVNW
ncbi:MAG: hypothetical protein HYZ15_13015 [Sphingobacteriales bacterium]|nr:hypothetical protein [Sphingobacteriales bacterium]